LWCERIRFAARKIPIARIPRVFESGGFSIFLVGSKQGPGFYPAPKPVGGFEEKNTADFEPFALLDQFVAAIQSGNPASDNHDIICRGFPLARFIV
jgi:hypothetical protein